MVAYDGRGYGRRQPQDLRLRPESHVGGSSGPGLVHRRKNFITISGTSWSFEMAGTLGFGPEARPAAAI